MILNPSSVGIRTFHVIGTEVELRLWNDAPYPPIGDYIGSAVKLSPRSILPEPAETLLAENEAML